MNHRSPRVSYVPDSTTLRVPWCMPQIIAVCFAVGAATISASAPAPEPPAIELIYGYRYPESFMKKHLEQHLKEHGLNVNIRFSSELRHDEPWLTDTDHFLVSSASGFCPVHALSFRTVPLKWFTEGFVREIPKAVLESHAHNYNQQVLTGRHGESLYKIPNGGWYALSGYSFPAAENVYHLMATQTTLQQFSKTSNPLSLYDETDGQNIPLYLYEPIDFAAVDEDLRRTTSNNGNPALLAWSNFEQSFAPLYSAFSIQTLGSNLVALDSTPNAGISYFEDPSHGLVPNAISTGFRDFIRIVSEWYEEKVINADFADLTYSDAVKRTEDLHYSYVSIPFINATQHSKLFTTYALSRSKESVGIFQVTHPSFDVVASLPQSPFFHVEAYCSSVTDDQLRAMLLVFDYTRVPGKPSDGWMKRVFGRPSKDFHRPDGIIEPFPRTPADEHNPYMMWHFKRFPEVILSHDHLRLFPAYTDSISSQRAWSFLASRVYSPRGSYGVELTSGDAGIPLARLTREYVLSWIRGERDIDADWPQFVKEWLSEGGSEVVRSLN